MTTNSLHFDIINELIQAKINLGSYYSVYRWNRNNFIEPNCVNLAQCNRFSTFRVAEGRRSVIEFVSTCSITCFIRKFTQNFKRQCYDTKVLNPMLAQNGCSTAHIY